MQVAGLGPVMLVLHYGACYHRLTVARISIVLLATRRDCKIFRSMVDGYHRHRTAPRERIRIRRLGIRK